MREGRPKKEFSSIYEEILVLNLSYAYNTLRRHADGMKALDES
jgi:hypothetical protein